MNSIRHAAFALALVVFAFALSANGATVFEQNVVNGSNYELTESGNWSSGLPTLTNLGTIGLDSTEATAVVLTSWDITQTAGTIGLFGGLTLSGGSIFTITGGDTVVNSYTANDTSVINFTTNSTGTLTILGNDANAFEALWNAGSLQYEGGNAGSFSDHFYSAESTIGVVPEPATMSLLALGGIAMLKRRKK